MQDNDNQKKIIDVDYVKEESIEDGYKAGTYTEANTYDRTQPLPPVQDSKGMYNDYGSYYDKPEDRTGEGYGIASLVLGIIGILCTCCLPILGLIPCVLAIIFGGVGMKAINRGLAIAGLSLGIVGLLPQLFFLALMLNVGF